MGNVYEKVKNSSAQEIFGSKKRKRDETESEDETVPDNSDVLNTPKRKRIKSTSKFIYQKLFLDSEDSDVTIRALEKDWKLHKLYLSQSPYFASMLSGGWKESAMDKIEIQIDDENITDETMKITFGSLYKDDVFIKPVQVVGVLAAATLFQLDGLIQQCALMMADTLSHSTACVYHAAAATYGLEEIRSKCFDWLLSNLLVSQNILFTKDISISLMEQIVSSPSLAVMQVEIDVYSVLKKWMFLHCNPSWTGSMRNLQQEVESHLKKSYEESGNCFLETEDGKKFIPVFSLVRWQHVINDMACLKMLEADKVVPIEWLEPMFLYGWRRILHVEQGMDKGPETVDEDLFLKNCIRCGRVLPKKGVYCWRWVGYSYGLDLLLSVTNRLITLKRNTHTEACPQAVSLQAHRHICYRLTISTLDKDGKTTYQNTWGIKKISLGKDEEEIAMVLEKNLEYPLVVHMNLMLISPLSELPVPYLKIPG